MSVWRWVGLSLLLGQAACTVTAVSAKEDARPKNSCSSSDNCGKGESCVTGLCQSLNGKLEAVLLTATPSSDSAIPHLTFVTHVGDLATNGGLKNLSWPGSVGVTGRLVLPTGHCYPEFVSEDPNAVILEAKDGTLPLSVTFTLRQHLLGLSQQKYYSSTSAAPLSGYLFGLQVPSGEYDVYLAPPKRQKGSCVVPPQLFRAVSIGVNENSATSFYRFTLASTSNLDLHVIWPDAGQTLVGWRADILEPLGGYPISTEVVLSEPTNRQGKLDYAVPLAYSAVSEDPESSKANVARELLRLRPPEDLDLPVIYLERSGLGVLQRPGEPINVTIFNRFPQPVSVRGQIVKQSDGRSVTASLNLVSKEIYGVERGVLTSFRKSVTSKSDGTFEVRLPPGKYAVHAVPPLPTGIGELPLSMVEVEWEVPADTPIQFGKLLELPTTSELSGQSRFQGAQVDVTPAPSYVAPFDELHDVEPFVPRSTGSFVDDAGRFVLQVDKLRNSRVNVRVEAPEELGFGWFVRPGLELGVVDQDLGRVALPLPAVISGAASVIEEGESLPLTSGVIRAYAYLDENFRYTREPQVARTIVQVAETRADTDGGFRLLLPETIDAPK